MFKGRMARLPYFGFWIVVMMLLVFVFTSGVLSLRGEGEILGLGALIITHLILFYSVIKRLHDLDKSGWWSLLILIPKLNFAFTIYLLFAKGTEGANRFGEAPTK